MAERVAIVTGGERGIGRSIVERLLRDGFSVGVLGVDDEAAVALLRGCDAGKRLCYAHCDVGEEEEVRRGVAEILDRYGRLDALVANAGIARAGGRELSRLELRDWEAVLRVNLTGPLLCAKHACAELRKTKGAMVLIASTRAMMSEPNTFAYSASKGGLVALAHSLAISLGPEVRVNCISPGWIHTGDHDGLREVDRRQHPAGRVGRGEDIAGAVAYLVGGDAGFVTGQNLVVDGGMTKKMIYEE